jgi:SAM-dependent methyltransferase
LNEGTRPLLPPAAAAADRAEAADAPRASAAPPSPCVAGLPASDLVVEMLRTALDDQAAAAPPPPRGATAAGAAPHASPDHAAPAPADPPENRRDMSTPLDLEALMARQGADFVRHAYLQVLDREPDANADYYTAGLREGRLSKLEILGEVRFSAEGEAVGREVRGLKNRVRLTRAYRLPVVGRLLRIGTAVAGLPGTLRHLQRLEQAFAAETARTEVLLAASEEESRARVEGDAEARARAHALEKSLVALLDATASRQEERGKLTDDAVVSLADRMDALEAEVARVAERPAALAAAADGPAAADHSLDDLYLAFEDRFRGERGLVKERQAVHLPLIQECGAGTLSRPVLDVGCGRGEWLELLRDRDLVARGVDLNDTMVELCRGLGLDAVAGDAIEHLRAAPPGSLGAVTGFHIIEHLPFKVFVQLLDESLRALAPGGVVVFETPNPDNVLVGSRNFYLDPTHRNPMPNEMTVMIAEARGFARAHARPLHPAEASFNAGDKALGERLDGLFFGPRDYALVAWKP